MKLSYEFEPVQVYVETIVTKLFLEAAKYQALDSTDVNDALGEALERIGWDLGEEFGLSSRRLAAIAKECRLC